MTDPRPLVFTEALDLTEAQMSGDVLQGVVLIRAGMSKNRRNYSEQVLQSAAPVFEGVKAYNDHARQHKATDITGWYSNVRYESGALRADRHFTRTQAGQDVRALAEDIVSGRAPATLAGLSIAAEGRVKAAKFADGDGMEVESIHAAESVDDVATPAAGGSYLAAGNIDELTAALYQDLTYEEFLESRTDYVERLRKELKAVRQDDALKTALAEAERLTGELNEAQTQLEALTTERDTALSEAEAARRALLIEQTLNAVSLPASWKESLRQQLITAAPEQWSAVIQTETRKAKASGFTPRVEVTGAGAQVNADTPVKETFSPIPRPDEGLGDWVERIAATSLK